MNLTFVCRTRDVPQSACREFRVGARRVLVCEHEGRYYAHPALCPHQGNPLDGARLWDGLIDCPWHHFQYDVVTGRNEYPRRVFPPGMPRLQKMLAPLRTFATEVRGDAIFVGFPRDTDEPAP